MGRTGYLADTQLCRWKTLCQWLTGWNWNYANREFQLLPPLIYIKDFHKNVFEVWSIICRETWQSIHVQWVSHKQWSIHINVFHRVSSPSLNCIVGISLFIEQADRLSTLGFTAYSSPRVVFIHLPSSNGYINQTHWYVLLPTRLKSLSCFISRASPSVKKHVLWPFSKWQCSSDWIKIQTSKSFQWGEQAHHPSILKWTLPQNYSPRKKSLLITFTVH